jgi:DNA-binding response OmpR family regulator
VQISRLDGRLILVVEDEPLVGVEIIEVLTASGAHAVSARRVADAIKAVDLNHITAAVPDINLGGDDCSVLCQHLSQRRIPFVFYTGYAAAPDGWGYVPILTKPAYGTQIVDTVERLCRSHQEAA